MSANQTDSCCGDFRFAQHDDGTQRFPARLQAMPFLRRSITAISNIRRAQSCRLRLIESAEAFRKDRLRRAMWRNGHRDRSRLSREQRDLEAVLFDNDERAIDWLESHQCRSRRRYAWASQVR